MTHYIGTTPDPGPRQVADKRHDERRNHPPNDRDGREPVLSEKLTPCGFQTCDEQGGGALGCANGHDVEKGSDVVGLSRDVRVNIG